MELLLTEEGILKYLDFSITHWRMRKEKHKSENFRVSKELELMAADYIDAYQRVRVELFGEELEWL